MLHTIATTHHTHDLANFLPRTPRGKQRSRTATAAELAALYQYAGPGLRYCLICWSQLGMRFREPLHCTPADYDPEKRTLRTTTKGQRERIYPVTAALEQALHALPEGDAGTPIYAQLHGRTYNGKPIRWLIDVCYREWTKCRAQAGVSDDLHAHDLRRTAATAIHRLTGDVLAAQQLLGHRDLSTTSHYLKPFDQDRMRELIEQLDTRWIQ